ncbi:calcium-dependent phosphotriesterase [Rhodocollybia butyracea]|uniref:Calcium-dependent phosphotriesterase n=1 Tax=Rhodocollybia butyracea TaxID=206335 RepID=A0A9P5PY72_9AGAR|nr:calcium-dependent phosphotriesterase [Rhodocollybia butyracea]
MAKLVIPVLGVVFAILAFIYQIYMGPFLKMLGVYHTVSTFGLNYPACKKHTEIQACEKLVLHQKSGLLYLACSSLESRLHWLPATDELNTQGRTNDDYVAIYDPATSKITRVEFEHFNHPISVHGMDVVPSVHNPNELFVYMVNHRSPPAGQDAKLVGADSVIEVFKTTVGGKRLSHIKTVRDSTIITPNDVIGDADGKGFFFTNDHGSKTGFVSDRFSTPVSWNPFVRHSFVGYCHLDRGCKKASPDLTTANGIAGASNGTVYVAQSMLGKIAVFERQADDSLLLTDEITLGPALDNLGLDKDGSLIAAGFPKGLDMRKHMKNPSLRSRNRVQSLYQYRTQLILRREIQGRKGQKHIIENQSWSTQLLTPSQVFEDDGAMVSGATTVVHDSERGLLFMHGITSSHLTVCRT